MRQANGKACCRCGKPLTGRQARYCSDSCKTLAYRARNPEYAERQRAGRKAWGKSAAGKEWLRAYNKRYQELHPVSPEKRVEYSARYYAKNADKRREDARKRVAAKRKADPAFAERQRARVFANYQRRMAEDPIFRTVKNMRRRLQLAVQAAGGGKSCGTRQLVGCSWQELAAHLETQFQPGMTWDNYGFDGWHVDHIVPCASFDLADPEQQKACFHYTNLQPLWAVENMKKGARLAA